MTKLCFYHWADEQPEVKKLADRRDKVRQQLTDLHEKVNAMLDNAVDFDRARSMLNNCNWSYDKSSEEQDEITHTLYGIHPEAVVNRNCEVISTLREMALRACGTAAGLYVSENKKRDELKSLIEQISETRESLKPRYEQYEALEDAKAKEAAEEQPELSTVPAA